MTHTSLGPDTYTLRPATAADRETITTIWHEGWREAHLGRVPAELVSHRDRHHLHQRVPVMLGSTTVATVGPAVVGFVMLHGDEVEQLYVDPSARGTGAAAVLLAHGEAVIGERYDHAWLAVVDGNTRARRFYGRNGWSDTGPFDNPAWTAGGATIPVPVRRYEKRLVRSDAPGARA
jgi:GNAT superfamily N-acetyltransferase